jgi:predicted membrane GTPase involved in stress response
MAQYFTVKAVFEIEDAKGKIKKQTEVYLVDAMSVTEAEARITSYLADRGENDFEIKSASKSNIVSVIEA